MLKTEKILNIKSMKIKALGHLTILYSYVSSIFFSSSLPHMAVYKKLAVTDLQWVYKKPPVWADNLWFITYHIFSKQHQKTFCAVKYLIFT